MPDPLELEYVPVADLRTYHRNPRQGNVGVIAQSLRVNGQYRALAANRGTHTGRPNEVLAGNHTLMAARELGWEKIAVTWVDVDDDQAARVVAADNRTADLGEYDNRILLELLGDLPDLDGTGYEPGDLQELEKLLAEESGAGGDGSGGVGSTEARRTLAERFGVPPFTLLDARQGLWIERKRAWIALGLRSEAGRDTGLVTGLAESWKSKHRIESREPSEKSWAAGTSIFDPVLTELLVRWYSAPGHRVLDPFAGGSVRGLVSTRLGRTYTGVDLRPGQVAANDEQASDWVSRGLLGGVVVAGDYTPAVTPVEDHGGHRVKRDDAWSRSGAAGAKSRAMFALAEGAAGIITAGARRSPQIERAALVAKALGIPCRVHVPDGGDTAEILTCRGAGAEVIKHTAGRLNVLRARFRDDAKEHSDWLAVPFGMGMDAYADDIASQVANLPEDLARIVVPCGSGMTTAGILRGLDRGGRSDVLVAAVTVGHDPAEYLDQFGPPDWRHRVDLIDPGISFETDATVTTLGGLSLDPMYEAKCLPHLRGDDLLWCVGIRASAPPNPAPDAEAMSNDTRPRWVVGDARNIRELLAGDDPYDLLLTCPPYFDLEVYSEDTADLSRAADYRVFLADYRDCLAAATDRMATDAFAAIVTGALRDKRGYVRDLPADTTRIMEDLGWRLYQDAVLATSLGNAGLRAGRQFTALRKLTRVHQMVSVYHRGNIETVRTWPPAEVGEDTEVEDGNDT